MTICLLLREQTRAPYKVELLDLAGALSRERRAGQGRLAGWTSSSDEEL